MPSKRKLIKLVEQLAGLKKKRGLYSHTMRCGIEVHDPDYYDSARVEKLCNKAKELLNECD